MVVGVLELTLAVPAASLKEKRGVVKRIVGRTRNKFNVSAAEVDELDNPGAAVLGIITVANDRKFINSVLNKIINFIDDLYLAEIIDQHMEITNY